ncbi:hypothetical protein F404_gp106 [Vibrio phage pVp-1]|uniref:Uncharacterized protein n=1 Tax=Vibrio phage pVp-1 TaxID=1150989 RepID=H6WXJ7_9CAUD|nr:hypothetical protein F404_gp106 [Vibrio phage pVp-1]AFB83963.1 hypothetical protein pVp-1_0106 [Vibrio phage pVp-1]
MRMLMLPLCLIAGFGVGQLIKNHWNDPATWGNMSCTELVEVQDTSYYNQEAKDMAFSIYEEKCLTKQQ